MRAAALAIALWGCWRGDVLEPARPAPPHRTARRTIPHTVAPPAVTDPASELALRLHDTLQLGWLATTIDRVVVLDDAGLRSVCDRDARIEAQGWETMLSDPAREPPQCFDTQSIDYYCVQTAASGPTVFLRFSRSLTGWHLLSLHVGADLAAIRPGISRVNTEVENGSCP